MTKKRLIFIFLAALFILSLSVPAFAVVDKSEEFYVADYAGVLSEETKKVIIDTNGYLEKNCNGAQIVVVSIEYLDTYEYSDEYANYLFNSWGVGDDEANNGMLLLLVTKEGKGWLAQGAGISSQFGDDEANEYLDDYFWKEFDKGNFDKAVSELFTQLVYWYENEYDAEGGFDHYYNNDKDDYYTYGDVFGIGFIQGVIYFLIRNFWIIIFIIVICFNIFADRRRYRAYYRSLGVPIIPRYHFWYFFGHRPHKTFFDPHDHHDDHRGPRGPRGGGGGFGGFGGGGFGGGFGGGSGFGGGGFSSGGGGGRR